MVADAGIPAGYKQTEVEVIPEDWDVKTLGHCADVKTGPFGSSLHEKDYVSDGTPIITVEHLGERGISYKNLPMVSDADKKRLGSYILQTHDIVFSRVGSVDRNSLISENENGWLFSGRLLRIRLNPQNIYPAYLSYYFQQEPVKQRVRSVAVGQTMASLNTQILKNISIVLPPTIEEQNAIATILSATDALIERLEELIAKKRNIKQGAMQQLLTGKKRLPGFSGEWEVKKLGEIAEMYSGGTPLTSNNSYYGGQFPWVVIADMTRIKKYLFNTDKNITEFGLENSSAKLFKKGTLLFAMYASIGKCAIAKVDVTCNQAILGINTKRIETEFLYYYLAFNEQNFLHMGQAGTQNNLNKEIVQNLEIPYPPKEEQTAIATILSDMDSEIERLEQTRDKYTMIKQGMMQQLLTGRIRIHGTK